MCVCVITHGNMNQEGQNQAGGAPFCWGKVYITVRRHRMNQERQSENGRSGVGQAKAKGRGRGRGRGGFRGRGREGVTRRAR